MRRTMRVLHLILGGKHSTLLHRVSPSFSMPRRKSISIEIFLYCITLASTGAGICCERCQQQWCNISVHVSVLTSRSSFH